MMHQLETIGPPALIERDVSTVSSFVYEPVNNQFLLQPENRKFFSLVRVAAPGVDARMVRELSVVAVATEHTMEHVTCGGGAVLSGAWTADGGLVDLRRVSADDVCTPLPARLLSRSKFRVDGLQRLDAERVLVYLVDLSAGRIELVALDVNSAPTPRVTHRISTPVRSYSPKLWGVIDDTGVESNKPEAIFYGNNRNQRDTDFMAADISSFFTPIPPGINAPLTVALPTRLIERLSGRRNAPATHDFLGFCQCGPGANLFAQREVLYGQPREGHDRDLVRLMRVDRRTGYARAVATWSVLEAHSDRIECLCWREPGILAVCCMRQTPSNGGHGNTTSHYLSQLWVSHVPWELALRQDLIPHEFRRLVRAGFGYVRWRGITTAERNPRDEVATTEPVESVTWGRLPPELFDIVLGYVWDGYLAPKVLAPHDEANESREPLAFPPGGSGSRFGATPFSFTASKVPLLNATTGAASAGAGGSTSETTAATKPFSFPRSTPASTQTSAPKPQFGAGAGAGAGAAGSSTTASTRKQFGFTQTVSGNTQASPPPRFVANAGFAPAKKPAGVSPSTGYAIASEQQPTSTAAANHQPGANLNATPARTNIGGPSGEKYQTLTTLLAAALGTAADVATQDGSNVDAWEALLTALGRLEEHVINGANWPRITTNPRGWDAVVGSLHDTAMINFAYTDAGQTVNNNRPPVVVKTMRLLCLAIDHTHASYQGVELDVNTRRALCSTACIEALLRTLQNNGVPCGVYESYEALRDVALLLQHHGLQLADSQPRAPGDGSHLSTGLVWLLSRDAFQHGCGLTADEHRKLWNVVAPVLSLGWRPGARRHVYLATDRPGPLVDVLTTAAAHAMDRRDALAVSIIRNGVVQHMTLQGLSDARRGDEFTEVVPAPLQELADAFGRLVVHGQAEGLMEHQRFRGLSNSDSASMSRALNALFLDANALIVDGLRRLTETPCLPIAAILLLLRQWCAGARCLRPPQPPLVGGSTSVVVDPRAVLSACIVLLSTGASLLGTSHPHERVETALGWIRTQPGVIEHIFDWILYEEQAAGVRAPHDWANRTLIARIFDEAATTPLDPQWT